MFCIVILFLLLHIWLVTFISFISYTKVHLMHFNLIHFIAHSPSHIYHIWLYSYYILFQPHCLFLFFNQSLLWKLGVSLDKTLILNTYCIIWSWTPKVSLLFFTLGWVTYRFSYAMCFSLFQCPSCISCYTKNFYYFLGGSHLFGDSFFIFKENTL